MSIFAVQLRTRAERDVLQAMLRRLDYIQRSYGADEWMEINTLTRSYKEVPTPLSSAQVVSLPDWFRTVLHPNGVPHLVKRGYTISFKGPYAYHDGTRTKIERLHSLCTKALAAMSERRDVSLGKVFSYRMRVEHDILENNTYLHIGCQRLTMEDVKLVQDHCAAELKNNAPKEVANNDGAVLHQN